jgi:hypothetical protein
MRARVLVVSGSLGALLGAAVAYIGATFVFVCRGSRDPFHFVLCPVPDVPLLLVWGVPIGLAAGLMAGFVLSRRQSAR